MTILHAFYMFWLSHRRGTLAELLFRRFYIAILRCFSWGRGETLLWEELTRIFTARFHGCFSLRPMFDFHSDVGEFMKIMMVTVEHRALHLHLLQQQQYQQTTPIAVILWNEVSRCIVKIIFILYTEWLGGRLLDSLHPWRQTQIT
jgi:hypothetical protein